MHEAQGLLCNIMQTLCGVLDACNPSTGDIEAGESDSQGYLQLYSESKTRLR